MFYLTTFSIPKIITRQWQTDGTSLLTAGRMKMTGEKPEHSNKEPLSQYHFFQNRSHADCLGKEPAPSRVQVGNYPPESWNICKENV